MAEVTVLDVELHDKRIGTITRLPDDRILFAFSSDYIADEGRDTLSLSFKDVYGGLDADTTPTHQRLPTFFSNLLPEGHLRDYLAGRAGIHRDREFYLMWVLGRDLAGAVRVIPQDEDAWPSEESSAPQPGKEEGSAPALRFSLAGVQLKFSAVRAADGGLTIPANGVGGSWIVKLPSERFADVPENEFAMMELARRTGIDVPDTKLIPLNSIAGLPEGVDGLGKNAFAIRRFDRLEGDGRVHVEDFAQVFGLYAVQKYKRANFEMIARVLALETGEAGVAEFIRRFVFNALIGNGDMHVKNWSLIYPNRRQAAIAPAYDFVATVQYMPNETLALNFADTKSFADLDMARFERFADKARLSAGLVRETVKEAIARFHGAWGTRNDLPLPKGLSAIVEKHFKAVPIAHI